MLLYMCEITRLIWHIILADIPSGHCGALQLSCSRLPRTATSSSLFTENVTDVVVDASFCVGEAYMND